MRYNTFHTKDLAKFCNPIITTLANEVQKEIAKDKNFPFTHPLTNITSHDTSIEIQMAVPGLSKEDLTITIDKNQLTVMAEKEVADANFKQREFKFGTFKKTFNLPDSVNQNTITAITENGLLKITLEKLAEAQKKTINIL
jgi:HSP20 family protein